MVLKYISKTGSRIYGPPYTKAEEDEFYRRIGGGPITVARPASDRKATKRDTKRDDDDGSGTDQ
jgi:hypothetical protein